MIKRGWDIRAKLLLSYGVIILVAVGVVGLAARWLWARHIVDLTHEAARGGVTTVHFITALDRALLGAGLIAFVVAVLLGLLLSQVITAPLREMTAAARRLAAGDYSQRVTLRGRDEVAELAAAFNEMAAGLAATEQMRRELVANVAHELRTPLTSIEGYMEALEDGVFPAGPTTYRRIHDEAARLRRLVEDLTALARAETPGEWACDPVRLDRLALEAAEALRPRFEAGQVSLTTNVPQRGPVISGDADRLRQALDNLLDNALRHTPAGGTVSIQLSVVSGQLPAQWSGAKPITDNCLRITVKDTGQGIAPADLPHIFERFYRGDKSRVRATGGAGIGLTIVKHIIERHGGRIEVESAPGEGSTFTITLPL